MNQEPITETSKQWPQYLAALSAVLMSVSCGLHFGWPSIAIPKLLDKDLKFFVNKEEVSYVIILTPLGYIVGIPISAILLDKIGRKMAILALAAPQILAWLIIANSTSISMLYVARLIAGCSEGGAFTTIPIYIGEISETKIRGALGQTFTIALVFGLLLINCYGSFLSLKMSAYVSLGFPMLFLVTFIWMPESPYFFLMKDDPEKARDALKKLRKMNNVEEELARLTKDVHRQISEPNTMKDQFCTKSNFRAFLILLGLRTFQQFTGGPAITFYNQQIFRETHASLSYTTSSIIYFATFFISGVCTMSLVDRFGRRPMLLLSTIGALFALVVEGLYFSLQRYNYDLSQFTWLPLSVLVAYTIFRGMGLISIPTTMAGELFSANIKARAVGIVNIYFGLTLGASSKMLHLLDNYFGLHVPFFVFAFVSVCCIVFIYYCVPETKGKSLEEIQQRLKSTRLRWSG